MPSLLSRFTQHNFVAMATSLDKSEKKVQTHHLHLKRFHVVKRLQKIGPVDPEIIVFREIIKKR